MMVYVQGVRSGYLLKNRVKMMGLKMKTVFKHSKAFIEGANEPHYVENVVEAPRDCLSNSCFCQRHTHDRF